MDMAAQDAFDLRVPRHHIGEPVPFAAAIGIHVGNAGIEWRLMHHDDGRPRGLRRQYTMEPGCALLAHDTMVQAGQGHVEGNDAHRSAIADRVIDWPVRRQPTLVREGRPEGLAFVVIAGDRQYGHFERRQQTGEHRVFVGMAMIHQIAAQQHEVRSRIERVHMRDRRGELRVRIDHALIEAAVRADVWIGEMRDQHSGRLAVEPLETLAPLRRDRIDTALHPLEPAIDILLQYLGRFGCVAGGAQR